MSKEKNILQWQLFWFYCSGTNLCSQDIFHGRPGALFLLVFNLREVLLLYLLAFLKWPFFKQFVNQIDWWFCCCCCCFMSQWPFKVNLDEDEKKLLLATCLFTSWPNPLMDLCLHPVSNQDSFVYYNNFQVNT